MKFDNKCLDKSCVLIGWSTMGDLSNLNSKEKIGEIYDQTFNDVTKIGRGIDIGQIHRFVNETNKGDIILYYKDDMVYIGEVVSDYYFNSSEESYYKNTRNVEWIECKEIDLFSEKFRKSLNAGMTYFSMNKHIAELECILNKFETN
jgi:predicted Mrr-cat superfamily restriction endonuclease